MRISFISPFLYLLPLLYSCKNTSHHTTDKKYQFALHLTTGTKYYFNINTETISKVSLNGKDIETNNQSDMGLIYEVGSSMADSIQVKVTYDQLRVGVKNKNGEQEINAANAGHSFNKLEKLLGSVKGASMIITLNHKGDILRVAGAREITDKLMAATSNTQDMALQERIRKQVSKFIGDEFVRNNLSAQFKLFPDTAVGVGDTWKLQTILPGEIESDAISTYTFEGIAGTLVKVETTAEINANNKCTVMGSEVVVTSKGTQDGQFETDTTTGLMINGKSTTSMEGSFQVMGKEIPLTIKIVKHITGKKL